MVESRPPKLMRIRDVPRYIRTHHYVDVSRQTAYNWVRYGVGGQLLKTIRIGKFIRTRKEWVDAFLSHLSQRR